MQMKCFRSAMVWALCITGLFLLNACSKHGVNEDLDPTKQQAYDFMSTKSGSFWRYGSREGVPYTRYARNKDSMKNGKLFSYYERNEDTSGWNVPEYFGKNGSYYITLIDLDGIAENDNYVDYVFWMDDAKKGSTWQNTGSAYYDATGNVKMYTTSTEVEDSATVVCGPKTYNNVIHVHSDLRTVTFNSKIGTMDIWFIKNLGIIREEAHINVFGFYTQDHTDSLIDYHIAP